MDTARRHVSRCLVALFVEVDRYMPERRCISQTHREIPAALCVWAWVCVPEGCSVFAGLCSHMKALATLIPRSHRALHAVDEVALEVLRQVESHVFLDVYHRRHWASGVELAKVVEVVRIAIIITAQVNQCAPLPQHDFSDQMVDLICSLPRACHSRRLFALRSEAAKEFPDVCGNARLVPSFMATQNRIPHGTLRHLLPQCFELAEQSPVANDGTDGTRTSECVSNVGCSWRSCRGCWEAGRNPQNTEASVLCRSAPAG